MDDRDGATLRLPDSTRSPRLAREYAERFLRESGHEPLAAPTALVVSELVTNALVHTGQPCTLRLRIVPGVQPCARVEVEDVTPDAPVAPTETGTGLRVVADAAQRWGVERSADRKVVWAELS